MSVEHPHFWAPVECIVLECDEQVIGVVVPLDNGKHIPCLVIADGADTVNGALELLQKISEGEGAPLQGPVLSASGKTIMVRYDQEDKNK